LPGELVWGDDVDLSTRALNWRQCDRTKMMDTTTNGFFVMDGFDEINRDVMEKASADFLKIVASVCGGNAEVFWMDRSHPSTPDIMGLST